MMKRSCSARAKLTDADFAFVEAILVDELASPLKSLQQDPEGLSSILDLDVIHDALIGNPASARVSPPFQLYVLVRRAFMESGIAPVEIADRVAGEIVEKLGLDEAASATQVHQPVHFLCVIRSTAEGSRFHLQVAAGDNFLVLNGNYQPPVAQPSESENETDDSAERDSSELKSDRILF